MERVFGKPEGIEWGAWFPSRLDASRAGVHRPPMHGISGTSASGADSIVVSGGYEDDEDHGDVIRYTGHGGKQSRKQVRDQSPLDGGNAALRTSMTEELPVRVLRGADRRSRYAPASGYTYSGDYRVTDSWMAIGRAGFKMVFFRLELMPYRGAAELIEDIGTRVAAEATYATVSALRRVRERQVREDLMSLYAHRCQICSLQIVSATGRPYAEGAHIRPLGLPHEGDDHVRNMLCLCPNHHKQMDVGDLVITDELHARRTMTGEDLGALAVHPQHAIRREDVSFRRALTFAELPAEPVWYSGAGG
jgi:putative restriction endonuclease